MERLPVIDAHNHFFPANWPDWSAKFASPDWPWIRHTEPGKAAVMVGDRFFRAIDSACWDASRRLEHMDRDGIDIQVISATPVLFAHHREAAQSLECARWYNDYALEFCQKGRGRLRALCQVPLQDIDMACEELSRAMRAGHLGVQIGTHVGGRNLDDEGTVTFLQHCAAEGAAVLVHPWDMLGAERMPSYMTPWTVAMPAETQLSMVSLILSGALDRLPPSLRICFVHGGGSFPYLLGRLENAWRHHPVARGFSALPPSQYKGRFYVDSIVFDQRVLRFLVETIGETHVLLGSDYPFPLGEDRVGSLVRESDLPAAVKEGILCHNVCRWLGLNPGDLSSAPDPAKEYTYSSGD